MINLLYSLNYKLSNNHPLLEKTKLNSLFRYLLRNVANYLLPLYFRMTNQSQNKHAEVTIPVVVSLTSFPVRIGKLWVVVEAMLRQCPRPERVVLWLSRTQFPNETADLPNRLLEQQSRGLEIRFVDGDIRSHKKYFYVFKEFADKYVLTIDDDLLFPSTFVDDAYKCAIAHPNSVIAHFGSIFCWRSEIDYFEKLCTPVHPGQTGLNLFFGSGGGTLFPPNRMGYLMDDISTILRLCPTADDIYLNALCRIAGCEVTFRNIYPLLSIENKNDEKLHDCNGYLFSPNSANARQLRDIVKYCIDKYGKNPFDVQ